MGWNTVVWCALSWILCTHTVASPRYDSTVFVRSGVETVPEHEPLPAPIRASVESIPLRSLRDEGDERLPLRDAVEKRPIAVFNDQSLRYIEDVQENPIDEEFGNLRQYYGAANYLNKLQLGNANLQEMQQTASGPSAKRLIVCYMESRAAYRAPPLAFTAGLVPRSCTHLHYAFAVLHPHTYTLIPANEDYDVIKGGYRIATGLKRRLTGLRVMLSVGGDGTDRLFSEMVQEQNRRNSFIESAIDFLREHEFDGLDLHWVYPGEKDEEERDLFTSLLYELREKMSPYGLLLSTVLPPFRYQIEDGYDLSAVSGVSDYVVLQAWDMTHGKRDEPPSKAVQHSALHRDPGAASRDKRYDNIEFMVKYILRHGMAPEKLVLGVPVFGRSYTLAPSTLPAPGAPVTGWGNEGPYTQTKGLLAYFEICIAEREGKGATSTDSAGNAFAVFDNQWVAYDSQTTVAEKMKFVISMGLAGAAVWAIDMDDFRGLCGSPFPVLSTITTMLIGEPVQSDQSSLKIGSCESMTPYLASDEDSCAHFHFCTGGINFRIMCEDDRLYDPSTGFCGHRDVTKCLPGQSLRISVEEAARLLTHAYDNDFEWSDQVNHDLMMNREPVQLVSMAENVKKNFAHQKIVHANRTRRYFKIIKRKLDEKKVIVSPRARDASEDNYIGPLFSNQRPGLSNSGAWINEYVPFENKYMQDELRDVVFNDEGNQGAENSKRVVCYMTSWAFYRRGDGKFVPEQIDTRLCTHVVYAYGSLSPDELIAKEFDPWTDITNNLYERVTSLKDVKVLLGLGGWTDSAGDKYSRLVSSSTARSKFTEKLVSFLRMHNFKGLHLDWNYPVCWQSNCKKGAKSDKANYALLIQEVSKALHAAGMELGVAISGYKEVIESAYDLSAISKAADFLSAMTYDYHGGWESTTAHHTPLVPSPKEKIPYYCIEHAVKALISGGAEPKKLLLGLSFYGQTYRLAEAESSSEPGAVASGPGEPGEFTKQPGMLAYYEICYRVKNLRWKTGRQDKAGPYAYSDNQWVGYDDQKSITEKVEWAMRQGLGGVTAWAIDLDDFNNRCCGEPWPLLRAAGRALGRAVPQPSGSCERPPQPVTPPPPTTTTVAADGSAGIPSGDHVHPGHEHHTTQSTTWPAWTPAPTTPSTAQTWWPQATTTMKPTITTEKPTTTTTFKPTTTTTVRVTTRRTTTSMRPVESAEGTPCVPGEYREATGDCGSYLQCEGGQWRKQSCAPGLHWSMAAKRCDWPSFAQCSASSSSEASTATTTLAPMTSRPPPRPTTTRRTTTTTTTTTSRPTTSSTASSVEDSLDGRPCNGQAYSPVAGDCNAYLHCDGSVWRQQRCAPGLHWSPKQNHCDWPSYAKCQSSSTTADKPMPVRTTTKPTRPPTTSSQPSHSASEDSECDSSESLAPASSCDSYLLCVGGRWRKQLCPPGLHWDNRSKRCDWVDFAMCDVKPGATKTPAFEPTMTNKPPHTRPPHTRPTQTRPPSRKPITQPTENLTTPPMRCQTGTYHAHAHCEKFLVCVNGQLVEQRCAPGLVWSAAHARCDFPRKDSCGGRHAGKPSDATHMQLIDQSSTCENGEYANLEGDCTRYRHCLFGKFEEFPCSAGLHWNEEKNICDWPKNAKCKSKSTMTTPRPSIEISSKPATENEFFPSKPVTPVEPSLTLPGPSLQQTGYKLVCYYTNWAWYRPGLGKYGPEDIDPTLCTHIVYGFAVLGDDGLITAHDSWADYDNRLYERVVEFKRYGIKVSLALGGWNDSAGDKYSNLVNSPAARAHFVTHAVQFIEKYNFDGLDLDWEYPKCWQVDCSKGPDSDKEGFSDLVRELSALLRPKGLLLSSAVSPNKKVIDEGYDVPVLARHLDWIAVMTYDYHGQWDKKTGHVAPLYYHPDDDNTYFNANYTMHYWMAKGAPSRKLVMGIPMYGQTFTTGTKWDTDPELLGKRDSTGLNIPATAGGEPGEYTRAKGFLAYYEICDLIRNHGWNVAKDPYGRMGPYAYKGNQWVSFDDVEIVKKKTEFIKSLNLGGGMIWALDLDDFRNRCGQGKHPLLNTIKKGLLNPRVEIDSVQGKPTPHPSIDIDDDLDDIEVRPGYTKKPPTTVRPMKITSQMSSMVHTTKKPMVIPAAEERFKVVCYYTNWAWYRPAPGKYTPNDIDPSLCTHVVYAFAVLDADTLVMKPHDTSLDVENKFYEKVVALKSRGIRVVIGLGGWNDSAGDKYSRLVNNQSARKKFVIHAIDFIEQFGFDGLDLDWEYPKCWQVNCEKGPSSDKQGFTSLVKELRSAFNQRGLLLSVAVSGSKRVIDYAYDVPALSKHLDWIALMTYDYHGQWDKKTGHIAPMYASDVDDDMTFNVNFTVHYWIEKGAARRKLVLGVPMYGQSFALLEHSGNGLNAAADAGGEPGDETRARGFLAFYEICERIRVHGWQVFRDPGGRMGPYATRGDQWVSFDDDFMARHKAEYVRAMGLGGSMVWSLDLDDFTGQFCGCGKSPLLMNINHVLRDKQAPPPCALEEVPGATAPTVVGMEGEPDSSSESEPERIPTTPEIDSDSPGGYLDGKSCSGITFRGDDEDCNKYYLCINGAYMQLTCPAQLHWNENHCDLPSNSRCRSKANLRLTDEENALVLTENKPIIGCYFTNWAYYRRENGSFGPEQLDASMCTHVIYAWAHLDAKSFRLVSGNPELDVENDFYGKVTNLRKTGVKVILGVGGLEDSEDQKWRQMSSTPDNRKKFVRSVYRFLRKWNFDGLQLAWQYPSCNQVQCSTYKQSSERENFSALLVELSRRLRSNGMEFSAMVAASPEIASKAYDHAVLKEAVDWLAIAANDYYATTAGRTAYLMPLESTELWDNNFNTTIEYWSSVVPSRQIVIGIPAYARTYSLRTAANAELGAPVFGPGAPGSYTGIPGFLAFYERCAFKPEEWHETRTRKGTFAVYGSQWASYLRPEEVHLMASLGMRAGLRGAALWAMDLDDWRGQCSCLQRPLLNAMKQGVHEPLLAPTLCQ